MDSSKMQTSSGGSGGGGGDEEYNSRTTSFPTFCTNPSSNYRPITTPYNPQFNNSPSNYLNTFSQSQLNGPNPLPNLDLEWSKDLELDPHNYTTSSSQSMLQGSLGQSSFEPSSSTMSRQNHESMSRIMKNSKKRTRASRRAPTTVLTTDPSNFRAMVQQFTGIPAPPFTGGSSYSNRFEPLGSSFPYPLRPLAQKNQLFVNPHVDSSNITLSNNMSSHHGQYSQADQNMVMRRNNDPPMMTFESLLADEARVFGTKVDQESRISHDNIDVDAHNIIVRGGEGTDDSWIFPTDLK